MEPNEPFDESLRAVERTLAALKPQACSLDRERLMFLAGQASVGRGRERAEKAARRWRSATAVTSLAAIGIAFAAVAQPAGRGERTISRDAPAPDSKQRSKADSPQELDAVGDPVFVEQARDIAPAAPASGPDGASPTPKPGDAPLNYVQIRQIALAKGVDALPPLRSAGAVVSPPLNQQELLEELLERQQPVQ